MYKWQLLQAAVISSVAGVLTLLVQIDICICHSFKCARRGMTHIYSL